MTFLSNTLRKTADPSNHCGECDHLSRKEEMDNNNRANIYKAFTSPKLLLSKVGAFYPLKSTHREAPRSALIYRQNLRFGEVN